MLSGLARLTYHHSQQPRFQLSSLLPRPITTILVLDDERVSRRVAYRILSEEGYRVLEAENCDEAIDALRLTRGHVDLVLVDVVMPEADGVEIARYIQEQWPDQRILYMSAHPAEVLVKHGLAPVEVHFLAKPFTRGEALAKVREALERRKPAVDSGSKAAYRILLVDDEDGIRSSLAKLLTKAGYSVTQARDGQEAIQLWRQNPGDLVILDMFMPEKDGIETIVELKAHTPAVRIIAISGGGAKNRVDILEDAKLLGADLVMEKPFDAAELLNMIEQVVNYSA